MITLNVRTSSTRPNPPTPSVATTLISANVTVCNSFAMSSLKQPHSDRQVSNNTREWQSLHTVYKQNCNISCKISDRLAVTKKITIANEDTFNVRCSTWLQSFPIQSLSR